MLSAEQKSAIQHYIDTGEDTLPSPNNVEDILYEQFHQDMPHGVATGDTGTPDEWFSENLKTIQEWIDEQDVQ